MASVNAAVVSLDGIVLAKLVQMTAAVSLEEVSDFGGISSLTPQSESLNISFQESAQSPSANAPRVTSATTAASTTGKASRPSETRGTS